MLDSVDLSISIPKKDYKALIEDLEIKLGALQRRARELDIPVVIVFEGWGSSGKGSFTNDLLLCLDPRNVTVHSIQPPSEDERMRPYLWRFWIRTPERGRIAIFNRSWYSRFLVEGSDPTLKGKVGKRAYEEVRAFERQLVDDGCVVVKFFLHISAEEQEKRFRALENNPAMSWRVTELDWKKHNQYRKYARITEEMLERTHTDTAPWTVVEAQDWRFGTLKVFNTVIHELENAIYARTNPEPEPDEFEERLDPIPDALAATDLTLKVSPKQYKKEVRKYQAIARDLEHEVYRRRLGVVIVYEGWDAAGKGGNIRRLVRRMDPRGYEVIPVSAPNDVELAHHYLWRFWERMPKAGHIAIFDRSWYGRVLVERVEGFAKESEWRRAYHEINEMEEHLVNFGTVVIKFWMHIDDQEQLQRFQARQENPMKRWKITEEDWRNRDKWGEYRKAVNEMIMRTDTPHAPWTIVESNDKRYARLRTLKKFCSEVQKRLR